MQDFYPSRRSAKPERLPRLDPVVHGDRNFSAPLDAALAERFDADGYIVLEDIFSDAELKLLEAESEFLLANSSGLDAETVIREPNGEGVRSIFRIHTQSAVMARLAADQRLAGVASALLGDDVYVHQSRLNYKPGFHGKEFYWHSDFETWHVEDGMPRMRALSMSVLLTDNTAHNGPLMLMPGSHRTFLSCVGATPENHYRESLRKQEFGVPDEASLADLFDAHGIVAPTGKRGTVVAFDCNTMHGSNSNITPVPRSNAFIVYNAVSNRLVEPFGAPTRRPDFVAERSAEPVRVVAGPLHAG